MEDDFEWLRIKKKKKKRKERKKRSVLVHGNGLCCVKNGQSKMAHVLRHTSSGSTIEVPLKYYFILLLQLHLPCVLGPLLKFNLAHLILPLMRLANDSEIH